jgi:hypothetical protein
LVPTGSTQTLGTPLERWNALYIGNANSYGDPYTPIYWNNGVPEAVMTVQKSSFTFASGATEVVMRSPAFNENTIMITAVVTEGDYYLNAPIRAEYTPANGNT